MALEQHRTLHKRPPPIRAPSLEAGAQKLSLPPTGGLGGHSSRAIDDGVGYPDDDSPLGTFLMNLMLH